MASRSTIRRIAAPPATKRWALPGPVVIEAVVDPNEPPMPPKIKGNAGGASGRALARGTPHRGQVARTLAANTVRELV